MPTAWAVARNTVGAAQIKKNAVGKSEIKANGVTGSEVNEATLGEVPSAANATNAQNATTNATNATNAAPTNADTVGGNAVREVNYSATPGSGPQTILDLGGLQLTANLRRRRRHEPGRLDDEGRQLGVRFGIDSGEANDTDGNRDIDSGDLDDGDFDVGDALDLDGNIGAGFADEEHGFLGYFAPDGSTVTAYLVFDEFGVTAAT